MTDDNKIASELAQWARIPGQSGWENMCPQEVWVSSAAITVTEFLACGAGSDLWSCIPTLLSYRWSGWDLKSHEICSCHD